MQLIHIIQKNSERLACITYHSLINIFIGRRYLGPYINIDFEYIGPLFGGVRFCLVV